MNKYFKHLSVLVSNRMNIDKYDSQNESHQNQMSVKSSNTKSLRNTTKKTKIRGRKVKPQVWTCLSHIWHWLNQVVPGACFPFSPLVFLFHKICFSPDIDSLICTLIS